MIMVDLMLSSGVCLWFVSCWPGVFVDRTNLERFMSGFISPSLMCVNSKIVVWIFLVPEKKDDGVALRIISTNLYR